MQIFIVIIIIVNVYIAELPKHPNLTNLNLSEVQNTMHLRVELEMLRSKLMHRSRTCHAPKRIKHVNINLNCPTAVSPPIPQYYGSTLLYRGGCKTEQETKWLLSSTTEWYLHNLWEGKKQRRKKKVCTSNGWNIQIKLSGVANNHYLYLFKHKLNFSK